MSDESPRLVANRPATMFCDARRWPGRGRGVQSGHERLEFFSARRHVCERAKDHTVSFIIRPTQPGDHEAVLEVVRDAFTSDDADGTAEVDVVTTTWAKRASPDGFDLVAVDGEHVIGHVIAGVGSLAGEPAIGIAPLCVSPSRQGRGVGSALMRELLDRIDRAGWPFALLLGSPTYYPRFGFETASPHGIVYAPVGEHPAFQIRRYDPEASVPRGEFVYCFETP